METTPGGRLHGFRHPLAVVRRVAGIMTGEVEEAVPAEAVEAAADREVEDFREPAEVEDFREPAEVVVECLAVEGSREVAVFREPAEVVEEAADLADREVEGSREPAEGGSHAPSASAMPKLGATTNASS